MSQSRAGRTAVLLLAVLLTSAACASGSSTGGAAPDENRTGGATTGTPSPVPGSVAINCGQPFQPPPAGGTLTVTGEFPASAPAGGPTVTGTVVVTSREAVQGLGGPQADVFLVRDGRVASVPGPHSLMGVRWDLAPGQTQRLPSEVALVSCDPAGGALRPGAYDVYARVVFIPNDGPRVESFGGPWPLQLM